MVIKYSKFSINAVTADYASRDESRLSQKIHEAISGTFFIGVFENRN